MKKILIIIAICVLALTSVLFINTLRFTSKQIPVDPVTDINIDKEQVSGHLSKAIQYRTISYQDSSQIDKSAFDGLHKYLIQTFTNVHTTLKKEVIENYSLLYTWRGQETKLDPIVLMAHIDVVPVESGTESTWFYPPFSGDIAKGYIWGRGAMDDKISVMGILEAVEMLLREGFQPRRTVYLVFGHDEEILGTGAASIAALLKSRGVQLEYILDEGSAIAVGAIQGISAPIALIGIAEKGYVSIELMVEGIVGHSAFPPEHTAVGILSTVVHNLENNQFPGGIKGATRTSFEYLSPEMPFFKKMVFANFWLFSKLIERQFSASPTTNALIRTTTAATIFKGGIKENILPKKARAVVNFRILPGDSIKDVVEHVRKIANDQRIKIKPFNEGSEPSPQVSFNAQSFNLIHKTVKQIYPDVIVAPGMVAVATDSRHFVKLSKNAYRFIPMRIGPEDMERIHGTNERISIEEYSDYIRFLIQLIRNSQY